MIRTNVWMVEPWSVDERLDLQHGETQCQVCFS